MAVKLSNLTNNGKVATSVVTSNAKVSVPASRNKSPIDSILHYDADIDSESELSGSGINPFTFNILSPQYTMQADGSCKCLQVTNILASGEFPLSVNGSLTSSVVSGYKQYGKLGSLGSAPISHTFSNPNSIVTARITVKKGSSASGVALDLGIYTTDFVAVTARIISGPGSISYLTNIVRVTEIQEDVDTDIVITTNAIVSAGATFYVYPGTTWNTGIDASLLVKNNTAIVTATNYPTPYCAPGTSTYPYGKAPVDVFSGKRFLRSCGAVSNLSIANTGTNTPLGSTTSGSFLNEQSIFVVKEDTTLGNHETSKRLGPGVSAGNHFLSIMVRRGIGDRNFKIAISATGGSGITDTIYDMTTGAKLSGSALAPTYLIAFGSWWLFQTTAITVAATPNLNLFLCLTSGTTVSYQGDGNSTIECKCLHVYPVSYPVPYCPPGVTMPASCASLTNGSSFPMPAFADAETTSGLKKEGTELLDISVTNSLQNSGSCNGLYTANTKTLSNTITGSNSSYPRFRFLISNKLPGRIYRCRIEFSDSSNIQEIRLATSGTTQILTKNGNVFSGDILSNNTESVLEIETNGMAIWSTQIVSATVQKLIPATNIAPLFSSLNGKPDGIELGTFDRTGNSTTGLMTGSCTVTSVSGEILVDSGVATAFSASNGIGTLPVTPGSTLQISWFARKGTLSTLKYSVYDATNATNIVAPTTYTEGYNRIYVKIPATCSNIYFYPVRDPGVAGTMYFNSISVQKLIVQPMTLGARVMVGASSADLVGNSTQQNIFINSSVNQAYLLYFRGDAASEASSKVCTAFDGVVYAGKAGTWARYSIHRKYVQINAAGTQFRSGNFIEGVYSSIQWSSWYNFKGFFDTSEFLKLNWGMATNCPVWYNKVTAWLKQVSDSELLGAW